MAFHDFTPGWCIGRIRLGNEQTQSMDEIRHALNWMKMPAGRMGLIPLPAPRFNLGALRSLRQDSFVLPLRHRRPRRQQQKQQQQPPPQLSAAIKVI